MDIENAEWDVINKIDESILRQFRQMVIEFHYITGDEILFQKQISVFDKLLRSHLPVHIHANNYGHVHLIDGLPIPDTFEVTYARKGDYEFMPNTRTFPTKLDKPNRKVEPDYILLHFTR
jgi:hypothetical protein